MNNFLLKLGLNGIVIIPLLLWFTEATFIGSLITAAILSTIAYFIGDQIILRASNNWIATFADAILAFAFLWITAEFMVWSLTFGELLTIVVLLGVVEFIFHRIIAKDALAN